MFEFHGWLVLESGAPSKTKGKKLSLEEHNSRHAQLNEEFSAKVQEFALAENVHLCPKAQGRYMFTFQGYYNHCRTEVYELFKWVAENSRISYGMLYTTDGEGEYPYDFRVWVLKGSQFTEHGDPFLSPRIPHIGFPKRGKAHKYQKGSS